MDYNRLYEYRFRDLDQVDRLAVWGAIADDLFRRMGKPRVVLDPACGRGEFISSVPADERWAIDQVPSDMDLTPQGIHTIVSDVFAVDLPEHHFDGVLLSNILEHFGSAEDIQRCLAKMYQAIRPGGVVAVLGPNFKYCAKEYFDCADHALALTHISVEEHLYAAGFEILSTLPRYLPYSFRGLLPPSQRLTSLYLRNPWAFRLLGKQFLVVARTGE
jgi:ubiquinone/menaquinone biosynthesis C-methylase UbiE